MKRLYFAEHTEQVERAARMIADSFSAGGKLLLCGNGGSSTDAQHIAGEFVNRFLDTKRRALPALALSTDGGVVQHPLRHLKVGDHSILHRADGDDVARRSA